MTRMFIALVVAVALGVAGGSAVSAQNLNCDDFATQADAQANLVENPSDPNGLDRDQDGSACDDFDYPGGGGTTSVDTDDTSASDAGASDTTLPDTGVGTGTPSGGLGLTLSLVGLAFLSGVLALRRQSVL